MTTPYDVVQRRRQQRARLVARARRFAEGIDVLVVADGLPDAPAARLKAVDAPRAGLDAIVWSPAEWRTQRARGNPIAMEAIESGEWLVGDPAAL